MCTSLKASPIDIEFQKALIRLSIKHIEPSVRKWTACDYEYRLTRLAGQAFLRRVRMRSCRRLELAVWGQGCATFLSGGGDGRCGRQTFVAAIGPDFARGTTPRIAKNFSKAYRLLHTSRTLISSRGRRSIDHSMRQAAA